MVYVILFLCALVGTYIVRWYSFEKSILDIPNARSSHMVPTPRGGGLAIIIIFYIGLVYFKDSIDIKLFYALWLGIPVALVSILDDVVTLSSKVRFVVQSISAIVALYCLGGVSFIDFTYFSMDGIWVNTIAVIAILWLTNLYNFMDGIDGYAGIEALTVGLGIFILFHNPLGLVIAVASLGFLVFNWHPATIFMGDVGSATLGFLFAILLFSDTSDGNIYVWMVLLSLFWFDATVTLLRRYQNKESVTQAHKKHAYQRLVQSGWSHKKVSAFALLFNGFFVLLLYMIEMPFIVWIINIVAMCGLMYLIEKKKAFA